MDREQRPGAALLRLLQLLWLLPSSRTAPEGMTVPLLYGSPDRLEPRESSRALEVFFAFEVLCCVSGKKYYGVLETIAELGKRSTLEGCKQCQRCFIYSSYDNLLKQGLLYPFYRWKKMRLRDSNVVKFTQLEGGRAGI